MTALNKQALREAAQEEIMLRSVSDTSDAWQDEASPEAVLALLDELKSSENNLIDSECHVAELEEALRDKQALLESAEKRIAEHNFENRLLANADRDIKALRQRIAELEARQPYGYLRENDGQIQISIGSNRPHDRSGGYATPWFAIYTAAGIGVKGE